MTVGLIFWLCICSIIYAYAGYPLLLTLLSRLKPKPSSPQPSFSPSVTLLIAAHNEQAVISKKLENALNLDYPRERLQILVAADGSDDRTPDIVKTYASQDIGLSYQPVRHGKMAAIKRAVPLAEGEILIFSDANNMYDPETIRELTKPFCNPEVGAVSGAKLIAEDGSSLSASEGLYWKYESFIKKQETRFNSCVSVAGEILAIRRELFEAPPDYVINDDFYIAMQIARRGYLIAYAPDARSVETVSESARDEIARRARIIAGRYQAIALAHKLLTLRRPVLAWQIVSHKFIRPLVPFAMIGALLANLLAVIFPPQATANRLLSLASPFNWALFSLQITFYAIAWLGSKVENKGIIGRALYLPAFLINSNYAALVGLYRFLTGKQSILWKRVTRKDW